MGTNFIHLDALQTRLYNELGRLRVAKTSHERELRSVWVAQIEREIAGEYKHLGILQPNDEAISDDDLLAELMA